MFRYHRYGDAEKGLGIIVC